MIRLDSLFAIPVWLLVAGALAAKPNIVVILTDDQGYLTTRLTEEAVAFIRKNKSQPFFLYLACNAVHATAPSDKRDVSARHPEIVRSPEQKYDEWLQTMAEPTSSQPKRWDPPKAIQGGGA